MNAEKLTRKSLEAVEECQRLAMEYSNQEVSTEHLLYSLLTIDDSLIKKLLEKQGIATAALIDEARALINAKPHVSGSSENTYMGQDMSRVLLTAETEAKNMKDDFISVEHLFIALMEKGSSGVKDLLKKFDEKTGDSLTAAERLMGSDDKDPSGSGSGKKKKKFWE